MLNGTLGGVRIELRCGLLTEANIGDKMTFFKITAFVGATMLAAPAAMAATILIDDFTDIQEVRDTPDGGFSNTDTVGGLSVLGGSRTLTVLTDPQNGTGTAPGGGSILKSRGDQGGLPNDNTLGFSNLGDQAGLATVTYGVAAGGLALGDLTDGNINDRFFFEVLSADLEGTVFTTTVTTDGGVNTASFQEIIGMTFNPFTNFSNFVGVNFMDVTSLTFSFDTRGVVPDSERVLSFDGTIGSVSVVPLPFSALLLLGGLGGLAGASTFSKRRRQKA